MVIFEMPSWANGRTGDAATLAAEANTPTTITPTTLTDFFGAVVAAVMAAGGTTEEAVGALRELWGVNGFIDRAEAAMVDGNRTGLLALLDVMPTPTQTAMGAATLAAIQTVIDGLTLTAGAALWNNEDGEMPETFTAAWVTQTLTAAGYVWNGTAWARA